MGGAKSLIRHRPAVLHCALFASLFDCSLLWYNYKYTILRQLEPVHWGLELGRIYDWVLSRLSGQSFTFTSAMARSWTARLAVTIAASQLLTSVSAQSTSPVTSTSPSSTDSSEPKVHMIKAGAGGWKFDPQEIHNVSVGDIVKWEFYPPDHSVARAEFGSACVPYEYTGNDKVGFWSETQWVNNTNEVCSSISTLEHTQDILTLIAHVLQHNSQRHSTHILLLRRPKFMYRRTHGRRHQPKHHTNSSLASSSSSSRRLPGSARRPNSE
jgi:plastocyanin